LQYVPSTGVQNVWKADKLPFVVQDVTLCTSVKWAYSFKTHWESPFYPLR